MDFIKELGDNEITYKTTDELELTEPFTLFWGLNGDQWKDVAFPIGHCNVDDDGTLTFSELASPWVPVTVIKDAESTVKDGMVLAALVILRDVSTFSIGQSNTLPLFIRIRTFQRIPMPWMSTSH